MSIWCAACATTPPPAADCPLDDTLLLDQRIPEQSKGPVTNADRLRMWQRQAADLAQDNARKAELRRQLAACAPPVKR